jgi:hypothetical protein
MCSVDFTDTEARDKVRGKVVAIFLSFSKSNAPCLDTDVFTRFLIVAVSDLALVSTLLNVSLCFYDR